MLDDKIQSKLKEITVKMRERRGGYSILCDNGYYQNSLTLGVSSPLIEMIAVVIKYI